MSVKFVKGDMFVTPVVTVIAHGVNLRGVFGAGIAEEISRRHPWAKKQYMDHYRSMKLGDLFWAATANPQVVYRIANLATQEEPGPNAKLSAVEQSLRRLKSEARSGDIVALPQIGCGIGGLKWWSVKDIIQVVFKDTTCRVLVFEQYERGCPAVSL